VFHPMTPACENKRDNANSFIAHLKAPDLRLDFDILLVESSRRLVVRPSGGSLANQNYD
jgi:hypothetical protein